MKKTNYKSVKDFLEKNFDKDYLIEILTRELQYYIDDASDEIKNYDNYTFREEQDEIYNFLYSKIN
jgi:hypothetical protein